MSDDTLPIRGIGEVGVYVKDLDRAEEWYTRILDLEVTLQGPNYRFLKPGPDRHLRQRVILFDPERTENQSSPPPHGARGPTHFALGALRSDLPLFRKRLQEEGVDIEEEITWPSGAESIYFRDPAGNSVEIFGQIPNDNTQENQHSS